MLKKIFFLCSILINMTTFNATASPVHPDLTADKKNAKEIYELQESFNLAVLGSNPQAGYTIPVEEQKNAIRHLDKELKKREIWYASFLKNACNRIVSAQENLLGIDVIRPEIVELLIELGYSSENIIIPLLEKFDLSKINENVIQVIKILQKKCTITQEEQQKALSILNEKKKIHCTPLIHFTIKMKTEAQKKGDELIINPNYISASEVNECINIKTIKKLFKPQKQDNNQKN